MIHIITVLWHPFCGFVFVETKKYMGKPKLGKLLNKKALWVRTTTTIKILEMGSVERIIVFSTYVLYNMYM